jgi:uncharacterized protein (TIGR00730 family)
MKPISAVTVYCSSSATLDPVYLQAAEALGRALAEAGWALVYGGNCIGMMGSLANATRAAGGRVIGITPQVFVDKGLDDKDCDELVVTSGMRDRKQLLEDRGDAFIALPGGLGTFEELFDIITSRQLDYHDKPIVILNIAGYYDPLLAMIDHGIAQHFIKPKARKLFHVSDSVKDAIDHLSAHHPATRTGLLID